MPALIDGEARAMLYRLINEAAEAHQSIMIWGKRNSAVWMSMEDWSGIQETLHLLSMPGVRDSIAAGMAEPLAMSPTSLKW